MRRVVGNALIKEAEKDPRIILLSGDYEGGIKEFKARFPERYFNMGTCEQSLVALASGMAIEGLKPVLYSITPFLLERAFEQVKLCIDHQNVPVILIGYDDYTNLGCTHVAINSEVLIGVLKNTKGFFPKNTAETIQAISDAQKRNGPSFICLKKDKSLG